MCPTSPGSYLHIRSLLMLNEHVNVYFKKYYAFEWLGECICQFVCSTLNRCYLELLFLEWEEYGISCITILVNDLCRCAQLNFPIYVLVQSS